MNNLMGRMVPTLFAWIAIIIALALGPTIVTNNAAVTSNVAAATNAAYMIGMTAVDDFGGFLIILSIMIGGGFLAVMGGRNKNTTIGDIVSVIGSALLAVVTLNIFSGTVIGYIDAMITAGTGFEKTVYGIFAILFYLAIIAGAGAYSAYRGYKKRRGGRRRTARSYM